VEGTTLSKRGTIPRSESTVSPRPDRLSFVGLYQESRLSTLLCARVEIRVELCGEDEMFGVGRTVDVL
jgi:hypothetical protein